MIYADDSWQLNPNMVDYESWSSAGFAAIKTNQRVTGFIAPNGEYQNWESVFDTSV
jgi:hypothetical protein